MQTSKREVSWCCSVVWKQHQQQKKKKEKKKKGKENKGGRWFMTSKGKQFPKQNKTKKATVFWNGRVWKRKVYQQSHYGTSMFTITLKKLKGSSVSPSSKPGFFRSVLYGANTRKDWNDYIWSFKFHWSLNKNPHANPGLSVLTTTATLLQLLPLQLIYFPCTNKQVRLNISWLISFWRAVN